MTSDTNPETDVNTDDTTTGNDISRNAGTGVGGFIVGGGYRGKREDQDDGVVEFANRLAREFPEYDIDIRFNSDQLSGGAWLKDSHRSSRVGLGVALTPPEWHEKQTESYIWGDGEEEPPKISAVDSDELQLIYTVKLTVPAVAEHRCNRMTDRADRDS